MGKDALGRDTTTDMWGNEHKVDAGGCHQQDALGRRTEQDALGRSHHVDILGRRISDNSQPGMWGSGSSGGSSRDRYGIIGGASGYSGGFPTRQTLSVIAAFVIFAFFVLLLLGVWHFINTTLAQIGLTGTVNTASSLLIFMFTFGVLGVFGYILIRHRKLIMLTTLGGFIIVLIILFIVMLKQPDYYTYNSVDAPASLSAPSAPHTQPSSRERSSSGQERASTTSLAHPTVAELNLRPEPRVGSGTLAVLYPEDTVTVLGVESEDGSWVKVRFGEHEGWISKAYLSYE